MGTAGHWPEWHSLQKAHSQAEQAIVEMEQQATVEMGQQAIVEMELTVLA
eukprot:CAMPEP_0206035670 /NCGR_PEP_ID=MMETSP1466-20131121/2258_1 /ASSEMBLY_ACC=CAM_ASM_001126 /TAXON_ID=44452 /ORGANISM="Pavlova gyrans, Strain CCMP608" /LENGTH=49 /DNA_ID= /DNA_START= /DNA_END= /DNA_ORIENTATION=